MKNPMELWKENKNPFQELEDMRRNMDRWFSDFAIAPLKNTALASFNPSCEVSEDKQNYYFKFDLPGMKKNQINVELVGNTLTVSAERKEESEKESRRRFTSELYYGAYSRAFTLPSDVEDGKIDAKYEDGVLSLTVPKTEHARAKTKQISVH